MRELFTLENIEPEKQELYQSLNLKTAPWLLTPAGQFC